MWTTRGILRESFNSRWKLHVQHVCCTREFQISASFHVQSVFELQVNPDTSAPYDPQMTLNITRYVMYWYRRATPLGPHVNDSHRRKWSNFKLQTKKITVLLSEPLRWKCRGESWGDTMANLIHLYLSLLLIFVSQDNEVKSQDLKISGSGHKISRSYQEILTHDLVKLEIFKKQRRKSASVVIL